MSLSSAEDDILILAHCREEVSVEENCGDEL